MQALRTTMLVTALIFVAALATAQSSGSDSETDSTVINLPFPFGGEDQFNPIEAPAGFDFAWPENFTYNIVLDEETGLYSIQQLVGDTIQYRPSTFLTLDEYLNFDMQGNLTEYWNELQIEDLPPIGRALIRKYTAGNLITNQSYDRRRTTGHSGW